MERRCYLQKLLMSFGMEYFLVSAGIRPLQIILGLEAERCLDESHLLGLGFLGRPAECAVVGA